MHYKPIGGTRAIMPRREQTNAIAKEAAWIETKQWKSANPSIPVNTSIIKHIKNYKNSIDQNSLPT